MSEILSLYESFTASRVAIEDARKKCEADARALLAAMPEGVTFSTVPNPPTLIKRVGDKLVAEVPPYIGVPYEVGK